MPKNCSIFDISKEKNCKQSKTADLASLIELKVNAGLMKPQILIYLTDSLLGKLELSISTVYLALGNFCRLYQNEW